MIMMTVMILSLQIENSKVDQKVKNMNVELYVKHQGKLKVVILGNKMCHLVRGKELVRREDSISGKKTNPGIDQNMKFQQKK